MQKNTIIWITMNQKNCSTVLIVSIAPAKLITPIYVTNKFSTQVIITEELV